MKLLPSWASNTLVNTLQSLSLYRNVSINSPLFTTQTGLVVILPYRITEAYEFLGHYIVDNYTINDDTEEEMARYVYNNSNLHDIKENIFSFTIKIDNNHSFIWDSVLSDHYGPPLDRKANGKHWKHQNYSDDDSNKGDISIGKWHIPKKDKQSKINIQSNVKGNLLPAHFVTVHFPRLLEEVKVKAASKNLKSLTGTNNFNCNKCDHKTQTKQQLENHIKKVHKNILSLQSTEVSNKPPKFVIHPPMNVLPSTPTTLKCEICHNIFYKEEYLKEHMTSIHNVESYSSTSEKIPCFLCGTTFSDPAAATSHIQTHHEFQCSQCDDIFYDKYDLNMHISNKHGSLPECINSLETERFALTCILEEFAKLVDKPEYDCEVCDLTPTVVNDTKTHQETQHGLNTQTLSILLECEFCAFTSTLHSELKRHIDGTHAKLFCSSCSFFTYSEFHLNNHIENEHERQPVPCGLCGISFTTKNQLEDHIQRRHINHDNTVPNSSPSQAQSHVQALLLEEVIDMAQSLKMFKESTDAQLSEIRITQETLKDELKQIVDATTNTNSEISKNLQKLQTDFHSFSSIITSLSSNPLMSAESLPASTKSTDTPSSHSLENPTTKNPLDPTISSDSTPSINTSIPYTSIQLRIPQSQPQNVEQTSSTHPHPPLLVSQNNQQPKGRLPTSLRNKVLFVTDSIGSNSDIRHLEEATNTLIYTEYAYGAHYKPDAYFPNKNFCHVAPSAATKRDYKYVVFQGAATDISNLDTTSPTPANEAFWHEEVACSSKSMILAAESVLNSNPNIEKVIILDRIPRFDPPSLDPSSAKPKLSQFGNQLLRNEVRKSNLRNKILVLHHCLPANHHHKLYGNPHSRGYDGVHLYGPEGSKSYTWSLCNILQNVFSENARSLHNHNLSSFLNKEDITLYSSTSHRVAYPPSVQQPYFPIRSSDTCFQKPDFVAIDIEDLPQDSYPLYSVPTSNFFDLLGN